MRRLVIVSGERGRGDFEILPLFYLDIELGFQIINITMVSFEFLCLIFYWNSYVSVFIKGVEATCVEIATAMAKCSWLKDMSNFNVL